MVRACREAPQHPSTFKSTRTERTMKEQKEKKDRHKIASIQPCIKHTNALVIDQALRNTKTCAQSKRHISKAEYKSASHYTAKHRSLVESGKYTRISDEQHTYKPTNNLQHRRHTTRISQANMHWHSRLHHTNVLGK